METRDEKWVGSIQYRTIAKRFAQGIGVSKIEAVQSAVSWTGLLRKVHFKTYKI